jgi:hypothetical protein
VSEIDGNGMLGSCVVIPAFWSAITPVDTWTKISLIYFLYQLLSLEFIENFVLNTIQVSSLFTALQSSQ